MITASKAFIAFCLLALVGTVLVIGPTELRRMLPGGANTEVAVAAKPAASLKRSRGESRDQAKAKAGKRAEARRRCTARAVALPAARRRRGAGRDPEAGHAALADIAPVKPPPAAADTGPRFDVARVDDHGEAAVIAGQAAPGAKVELLRDGQPLDSVVADASGQFVMTPPKLPAGSYELTPARQGARRHRHAIRPHHAGDDRRSRAAARARRAGRQDRKRSRPTSRTTNRTSWRRLPSPRRASPRCRTGALGPE